MALNYNWQKWDNFEKILTYYINNKRKSTIDLIQRLSDINFFWLNINLDDFKTLDDFKNEKWEIDYVWLKKNYQKILEINENKSNETKDKINEDKNENKVDEEINENKVNEEINKEKIDEEINKNEVNEKKKRDKKISKKLNNFDNFVKTKNIDWLENLLMDNLILYFNNTYHKKIKIKIISDIKKVLGNKNIDINTIDDEKIDNPLFIEAYKLSINPSYNKTQINKLLLDYLTWKFDNINDLNQYNTLKNKYWISKNLTKNQQRIWLEKNTKEIVLEKLKVEEIRADKLEVEEIKADKLEVEEIKADTVDNTVSRINNHIEIAIKKIEELNKYWFDFQTEFTDKWDLKKYFNLEIKKKKEEINNKIWNLNLFEDLKLQIDSILELEKQNSNQKSKKSNKIIIEKELDPLKTLMMWNWVDWSCLSFYSSIWNYYSAISNTIDVNKWVFYIKNEEWILLWRCLITIWNDKKLSRYKMYYSWNVDAPIDKYFDEFIIELADKMKLELNWDENKVKLIESEQWYKDWIKTITKF